MTENLEFGEPEKKPKGYYSKIARKYVEEFIQAIKIGKCTTNMAKIVNPKAKKEKMQLYNSIKALRRHKQIPSNIDVAIIENDLWLIFEGK